MKRRILGTTVGVLSAALLSGCDAEYAERPTEEPHEPFGNAEQAVAACDGDDLQYDFNGFAASLAVAIANELGHWDVATDFAVSNGKLALTSAGQARCARSGCENINALLLMQEDVTGVNGEVVPFHSAGLFRSKLTSWYQSQMVKLTELATAAVFPPGIYRFRGRQSNKYMVVDGASTASGALVEQKSSLLGTNGDWEVSIVGQKHKLKNMKSGMCLDLKTDSASNVDMVQKPCSSADSQLFKMTKSGEGTAFLFQTKYAGKGLFVAGHSTGEDAKITQANFDPNMYSSQWNAALLNGTVAQGLFKGMYTFTASHSNKLFGVANGNAGTNVTQHTNSDTNPMLNWYALPMGTMKYQFVNRSSGKCMALDADNASARIVQKDCANSDTQVFTLTSTGSPDQYTLKSKHNKLLEIEGGSNSDGALVRQAVPTAADPQRRFKLTPILAGEPHRLSFSHTTPDADCGDYFWFDVTQPNGLPLANPAETYIQLIFAGGKKTITGTDDNPFIDLQVSGNQVAIDPSGYMLPGTTGGSGSCIQGDVHFDPTKLAGGSAGPPEIPPLCCTRSNGVSGALVVSPWSTTTFLCR